MKSTFLLVLAFMLVIHHASNAQSVAHIDLVNILNELPPPPASIKDAATKVKCSNGNCNADGLFTAFEHDVAAAQSQWSKVNAGQQHQIDSAKRMADMMKPVAGKSKTEQLEAAKNLPGANKNALSLAQQMQDPEFRKKFNAMSREEKLAYVQGHGVGPTAGAGTSDDAGLAKTKQDFQQRMMNDPAFRTQWKKMSPAEQDAYMKQQANANGTDWKAVAARGRQNAAKNQATQQQASDNPSPSNGNLLSDDDAPASHPSSGNAALIQQANQASGTIAQIHFASDDAARAFDAAIASGNDRLINDQTTFADELKTKAAAKHLASIDDGPGYHRVRLNAIDREVSDADRTIAQYATLFKNDKEQLSNAIAGFNSSLMNSNYGATFTSAQDQQQLSALSIAQVNAIAQMQRMETALKSVYVKAAKLAQEQEHIKAEHVGPYRENKTDGE